MRSGAAAGWTTSCESRRSTCGSSTTPSSARARCAYPSTIPIPRISSFPERESRTSAARPRATRCIRADGGRRARRRFRFDANVSPGRRGGKPTAGKAGVQPEWFYKGDGSIIVPPGTPLTMPAFAVTGGEEAEIVGVYVVDDRGTPRRIGFVLGNEFSDHGLEEQNYLYSAHLEAARMLDWGRSCCWATCRIPCAACRACCAPARRCGKATSRAARTTCRTRSRTSSSIISSTRCSAVRGRCTATSSAPRC